VVVLDACRDNPFKAVSRSGTRGLKMIESSGGSIIAFATSPGRTASDESVFTAKLIEHLGDAVEVRSMFNRVADAVARKTRKQQVPWISASGLTEEYYLRAFKAGEKQAEMAVAREEEKPVETERPRAAQGPRAGDIQVEPKSGLEFVYIPAGTFHFGCEQQDQECRANEKPGTSVSVPAFWLGKTHVTVAAWEKCANAGGCAAEPRTRDEAPNRCNAKNGRLHHPMNCIKWKEARDFCAWAGGRLPEAQEWEYAAKSGESRIYPWGDEKPTGRHANFCDKRCHDADPDAARFSDNTQDDGFAGTSPVGSHPAGASKWGLLDMAGNVNDWTASNYNDNNKELRGGSLSDSPKWLRASSRGDFGPPEFQGTSFGFRCGL